ncbi:MAG: hypothetical protein HYT87_12755 [Nitrospirae bacterium]|nr:hypothetical protein [Nitrospirota bacterium]
MADRTRRSMDGPGGCGRRRAVHRFSYPLAQCLISTGLVYWVFLWFGWGGIFMGYPSIFAGVMIVYAGTALLHPRLHYLLIGQKLMDEFAITVLYPWYRATGRPVLTDPGFAVRFVSMAIPLSRAARYVVGEILRDRKADSGENAFAFCRRLYKESLDPSRRGVLKRHRTPAGSPPPLRFGDDEWKDHGISASPAGSHSPTSPSAALHGAPGTVGHPGTAVAVHDEKTMEIDRQREVRGEGPQRAASVGSTLEKASRPEGTASESERAPRRTSEPARRQDAEGVPDLPSPAVAGFAKAGAARMADPARSGAEGAKTAGDGEIRGPLKELELELGAKEPWVGTTLRYLTEERVPFPMSGEERVEDLFRRSQCLTWSIARQIGNVSESGRYASITQRIMSRHKGARIITIPPEGPGRPLEVLLGVGAKSVDDPEFVHWLGTGFLMAAVIREASVAGGWRVVMLCRERTVTPALDENDRGTETHGQLKNKFEQYREVLRWVPGATLVWVTNSEARALGILEDAAAVLPPEMVSRVLVRAMVGRESVLRLGGNAAPVVLGHLSVRMPTGETRREIHLLHDRRAGERGPGGDSVRPLVALPTAKGDRVVMEKSQPPSPTNTNGESVDVVAYVTGKDGEKSAGQLPLQETGGSTERPRAALHPGYMEHPCEVGRLVFPGYVRLDAAEGTGVRA